MLARQDRNGAADENVFAFVERRDAGMFFVFRAIDVARFVSLVVFEDVLDLDDGAQRAFAVVERRAGTRRRRFFAIDCKNDGNAPRQPVRKPHRGNDAFVVFARHEARERTQGAVTDQREIVELATGQRKTAKSFRLLAQLQFRLRGVDDAID